MTQDPVAAADPRTADVYTVLDELSDIVEAARAMPMSDKCVVNRNEVLVHALTEADLERTREYMRGSIADMRRLLRDPERNIAAEDDFRQVDDERACGRCSFRRVCRPGPA